MIYLFSRIIVLVSTDYDSFHTRLSHDLIAQSNLDNSKRISKHLLGLYNDEKDEMCEYIQQEI